MKNKWFRKTPLLFFLPCLFLASCGSKTSESTTAAADSVSNASPDNSTASYSEKFLTIKGKDVWVRDEPGTGKVVMKLNEGDQCKVQYRDQFEIIHGQADYWYKIVFNGQEGWVFGGQTDQASSMPPTFLTSDQGDFWKKLVETEKEKCRLGQHPGIGPPADPSSNGCECQFIQDGIVQSANTENEKIPQNNFETKYSACTIVELKFEKIPLGPGKTAFV